MFRFNEGERNEIVGTIAILALIVLIVVALFFTRDARADVIQGLENPAPGQRVFQARDNLNVSMDTAKIIETADATDPYVACYHQKATPENVYVATSTNLVTWTRRAELTLGLSSGSQCTIQKFGGSFFVAYEEADQCPGGPNKRCIRVLNYPYLGALLAGTPWLNRVYPNLNATSCEGTPNFYSAGFGQSDIGFHYNTNGCADGSDRQSRGLLLNYGSGTEQWVLHPVSQASCDTNLSALGANGNHGDRDAIPGLRLYEAQNAVADWSSWRVYATTDECASLQKLSIKTPGNSISFANPTISEAKLPNGQQGYIATMFLPTEGNASSEVGELIYWFEDVTQVTAAGDISCASATCNDDETANLLGGVDRVLALGDNQYESGELANYNAFYDPDWGRFKSITAPTPGNHDPCSSGYGSYFPAPNCRYSYDLGSWHLISLDSTNVSASTTFLTNDLAANNSLCTLAYWHHPRFSSGSTHGDNTSVAPFWDRLYTEGAEIVLNGHEHNYERFAPQSPSGVADPNGIREFVSGLGGKSRYSFGTTKSNSEFRYQSNYGVLTLTLRPTSYDWKFHTISGAVIDSGSGNCH